MEALSIIGGVSSIRALAKAGLDSILQIKRSIRDLKEAPIETQKLETQTDLANSVLQEVQLNTPESGSNMASVLNSFLLTLDSVQSGLKDCIRKDAQRKEKNQFLEAAKNFMHHRSSASMQKKEVEDLTNALQDGLTSLCASTTAESRNRIIAAQQVSQSQSHLTLDLLHKILSRVDEWNLKKAVDYGNLEQPENDMVRKLELANDLDIESRFCDAIVKFKNPGPGQPFNILVSEGAADDASGEDTRRGSTHGGYEVIDKGSLQLKLTVRESRFFHFVTYDYVRGAEPQLYYPRKTRAEHVIKETGPKRLFPNREIREREPIRWALNKAQGSSNPSTQSVFLILSKESLVSDDAKSRKARSREDLVMSDVSAKLETHLVEKLKGEDYQDLIVKHFKFDICPA